MFSDVISQSRRCASEALGSLICPTTDVGSLSLTRIIFSRLPPASTM